MRKHPRYVCALRIVLAAALLLAAGFARAQEPALPSADLSPVAAQAAAPAPSDPQPLPAGTQGSGPAPQSAAAAPRTGPDLPERMQAALEGPRQTVADVEAVLAGKGLTEADLNRVRDTLAGLPGDILARMVAFQPAIRDLNAAVDRLPPPPADGAPAEPEEIAGERARLADSKAKVTIALREAEGLTVRALGLEGQLLEARRTLFVDRLFERRILSPQDYTGVASELPAALSAVGGTLWAWLTVTLPQNPGRLAWVVLLTAVVGGLLYVLFRPFRRRLRLIEREEEITPLQRIMVAFFDTVLPAAAFAVLAIAFHQLMTYFGLYRLRIDALMREMVIVAAGVVFVALLLRGILNPRRPRRRLVDIPDGPAWRLFWLGVAVAVVYGLDHLLGRVIDLWSLSVSFTVAKSLVATLAIAVLLVLVVMTRLRAPGEGAVGYRGWHPVLYWAIWAGIIAIVVAKALGYFAFARFLAGQLVVTGSILVTMYIGYLAARAIAAEGAFASTRFGERVARSRNASDLRLDQIGLLLSVVINVAVLVIGLPILLLQWGFDAEDLRGYALSAVTGFSVGGVRISFGRLLMALLVFAALIAATRAVQRWFEGTLLKRTELDVGVKNSLKSGLGYVGYGLAAIVAISWAGFNLSNLALIAGALSVGIGFGLQNIVNNFVSGIIMLVERPIRVGDIVNVAGVDGTVRKINVRATEIETFQRQTVIIPNSEIINSSVGNWMHADRLRRVDVAVGVAYGTDPRKVEAILLSLTEGDERIAAIPEPMVYFKDFGASSLDFELRCYSRDLSDFLRIEMDLRYRIAEAFEREGIEIPFPQRDLNLRGNLAALLEEARETGDGPAA